MRTAVASCSLSCSLVTRDLLIPGRLRDRRPSCPSPLERPRQWLRRRSSDLVRWLRPTVLSAQKPGSGPPHTRARTRAPELCQRRAGDLMAQRPTVELAKPPTAEFRCLACALSFGTLDELKVHYKQEFHRANLQRKVSGLGPISAEEFERRVGQQEVRNSGRALLLSLPCWLSLAASCAIIPSRITAAAAADG